MSNTRLFNPATLMRSNDDPEKPIDPERNQESGAHRKYSTCFASLHPLPYLRALIRVIRLIRDSDRVLLLPPVLYLRASTGVSPLVTRL